MGILYDDRRLIAVKAVMPLVHRRRIVVQVADCDFSARQELFNQVDGALPVCVVANEMLMSNIGTLANQLILLVYQNCFWQLHGLIEMQCDSCTKGRIYGDRLEEISSSILLGDVILNISNGAALYSFIGLSLTVGTEVVVIAVVAVILDIVIEIMNGESLGGVSDLCDGSPYCRGGEYCSYQKTKYGDDSSASNCGNFHGITSFIISDRICVSGWDV